MAYSVVTLTSCANLLVKYMRRAHVHNAFVRDIADVMENSRIA
jgi:hypothetical protein